MSFDIVNREGASNPAVQQAMKIAKSTRSLNSNDNLISQIQSGNIPSSPHRITNSFLANSVDKAISNHLSLTPEQRIENSKQAEDALASFLGRGQNGRVKSLLGKNEKLMKSEKGYKGAEPISLPNGQGIETTGLPLSPAYQEGNFNVCPNHAACKDLCLGLTSGNYHKLGGGIDLKAIKGPRLNSLIKTLAFLHNPQAFAIKLHDEIQAAKEQANANGNLQGVRLNVLSDIPPRVYRSLITAHPDVSFYDYTKLPNKPLLDDKGNPLPNHHLTFSSTGFSQDIENKDNKGNVIDSYHVHNPNQNWTGKNGMRSVLDNGHNVAMAFSHKRFLPKTVHDEETGQYYDVIDGDTHDYRPMDKQAPGQRGVIIGLRNKKVSGKMSEAAKDAKGFFVHYDPQIKKPDAYERGPSPLDEKTGKPRLGKKGNPILGPILNPSYATNHEVKIPIQKESQFKPADDENAVGGMPQDHFAKGGLVHDPVNGLEEDDYLSQFHNLEHYDHDEDDGSRRRYWEPIKHSHGNLIKKALNISHKSGPSLPGAVMLARQLTKRGTP